MHAVIFRATIRELDPEYESTAAHLRHLALTRYRCREFISMRDGDVELSISWWDSLDDFRLWRVDPEHQAAQALGRERWYADCRIEVVEAPRQFDKARFSSLAKTPKVKQDYCLARSTTLRKTRQPASPPSSTGDCLRPLIKPRISSRMRYRDGTMIRVITVPKATPKASERAMGMTNWA